MTRRLPCFIVERGRHRLDFNVDAVDRPRLAPSEPGPVGHRRARRPVRVRLLAGHRPVQPVDSRGADSSRAREGSSRSESGRGGNERRCPLDRSTAPIERSGMFALPRMRRLPPAYMFSVPPIAVLRTHGTGVEAAPLSRRFAPPSPLRGEGILSEIQNIPPPAGGRVARSARRGARLQPRCRGSAALRLGVR